VACTAALWLYLYSPVKPEKHGSMAILDAEAVWVARIFTWMGEGKSALWVRDELNRLGVPTKHGRQWHDTTIGMMLRNPIYSGMAAWGRTQATEPKHPDGTYRRRVKSSYRKTDPTTWKYAPVPAIVTTEAQRRAIEVLDGNRNHSKRNTKGEYLVQGLLYCGYPDREHEGSVCGRKMQATARAHTDLPGYRCGHRYHDPDHPHRHIYCRGKVPARRLDELVWAQLVTMLRDPDTLLARIDDVQHQQQNGRDRVAHELEAAARTLTAAQAKLTKLTERNLAGAIDDATFDQLKPALTADRDAAQQRLSSAKATTERTNSSMRQWADIRAYCADIGTQITRLEQPEHFLERQALVRTLIHRVVLSPARVDIEGLLPAVTPIMEDIFIPSALPSLAHRAAADRVSVAAHRAEKDLRGERGKLNFGGQCPFLILQGARYENVLDPFVKAERGCVACLRFRGRSPHLACRGLKGIPDCYVIRAPEICWSNRGRRTHKLTSNSAGANCRPFRLCTYISPSNLSPATAIK